MGLIKDLSKKWADTWEPFLIANGEAICLTDLTRSDPPSMGKQFSMRDLDYIRPGDVVALIGDFNPMTIKIFLNLIDLKAIIVPLTRETTSQHEYFFDAAYVDWVIGDRHMIGRQHENKHELIKGLKDIGHAGLILFSTGTTGKPKAILHDLTLFLKRFETPRPPMRTLSFLLFDHIGGINTLLHMLFNKGTVVAVPERTITSVIETCKRYRVEVLPTTPTFLRMLLLSGEIPDNFPETIKVVTYGTERMDQETLDELCHRLPNVDFRQTFGMSELGIVRVKSEARDSLFMKIGGEGVETKIVNDTLYIRTKTGMVGYLNAPSPFDSEGWYNTNDIVEQKGEYIKVVGRSSDIINVGGLKFISSDVEKVALEFPGISFVKVEAKDNPITGQHVELIVQPTKDDFSKDMMMVFMKDRLPSHMAPRRIRIDDISIGHRFKKV